ncbi:transposase, partial [Plantactinospora sp. B6F1]|uniref:transposase n=1 Tax=Plantactinospora sp. B6F1 TaxID=3158971 RepID=UPI0032D91074
RTACPYVFPEGPCSGRSHRMPDQECRTSGTPRGPPPDFIPGTNAIESLNARFRRAVNARGHFPTEQAALKVLYLTVVSLDPTGKGRARWSNRWKAALNAFDITFDGRVSAGRH